MLENLKKWEWKKIVPTLICLGILFETAIRLLSNSQDFKSPSVLGGGIVLITAIILLLIFFLDYRYKEQIDNTIKQMGNVIKNLERAFKINNQYNNLAVKISEDLMNKTLGSENKRNNSYTLEKETETQI